jgi:hypothetical protein
MYRRKVATGSTANYAASETCGRKRHPARAGAGIDHHLPVEGNELGDCCQIPVEVGSFVMGGRVR